MIYVQLLEEAAVWVDGKSIVFPYKKAEALFYYLCQEQKTTREKAAALLWADNDEVNAKKNLRNALYQIRKLLGQEVFRLKGNTRMEINTDLICADVYEINSENILERFTNTFLENFNLRNCPAFDMWIEQVKNKYRKLYREKAEAYIRSCVWTGDFDRIRDMLQRLYILSITDEELYRRIMRAYLGNGMQNEALNVYRNLQGFLQREENRKPEYETICLMEEIRESQSQPVIERPSTEHISFFGRTRELRKLRQSEKSTLITGDIGIGKTAFIERYLEGLDDAYAEVVRYTCYEAGVGLPLRPFLEICTILQTLAGEQILPGSMGMEKQGGESVSIRVEHMVEMLIRKVIQKNGKRLFMVIDDFHWIDKESMELLKMLICRMKGEAVRFILVAESGKKEFFWAFSESLLQEGVLEHMNLPAFSREECENFFWNSLLNYQPNEEMTEIVYRLTEGKILYVTALVWKIRSEGMSSFRTITEANSVDELMEKSMDRLEPKESLLLRVLSCQAEFLTFRELSRAAGMDPVSTAEALEKLIDYGLIYTMDTFTGIGYSFVRKYVQRKIYRSISETNRRKYHKAIAECIEVEFAKTIQAYPYMIYHFREAGEIYRMYEYKVGYYIYYFTPVHEAYPDHMDCYEDDIPWTRQFVNYEAIEAIVEEIRQLVKNDPSEPNGLLQMKTEFLYGRCALFAGRGRVGLEAIGRCEVLARKYGDSSYLYRCAIRRLFYLIEVGDLREVPTYLKKVEERSNDSMQNRALYLRIKGYYEIKCGKYEKARRTLRSALRNYEMISYEDASANLGRAACLNCLCEIAIEERDYSSALRLVSDSIRNSRILDRKYWNGWHYINLMRIMYNQQNYASVYHYAELANVVFERSGTVWGIGQMEMILSMTCIEEKKYSEALHHLEKAYSYASKAGYVQAQGKLDQVYGTLIQIMKKESDQAVAGLSVRISPETADSAGQRFPGIE